MLDGSTLFAGSIDRGPKTRTPANHVIKLRALIFEKFRQIWFKQWNNKHSFTYQRLHISVGVNDFIVLDDYKRLCLPRTFRTRII